jgi:hypothetical protein
MTTLILSDNIIRNPFKILFRGWLKLFAEMIDNINLISDIMNAGTVNPRQIVRDALEETKKLILIMPGNEGQLTVIENDGVPAFEKHAQRAIENDFEWEDVDLQDYMDFVGEIIAEGNTIMSDACEQAKEIQEEIEEAIAEALIPLL